MRVPKFLLRTKMLLSGVRYPVLSPTKPPVLPVYSAEARQNRVLSNLGTTTRASCKRLRSQQKLRACCDVIIALALSYSNCNIAFSIAILDSLSCSWFIPSVVTRAGWKATFDLSTMNSLFCGFATLGLLPTFLARSRVNILRQPPLIMHSAFEDNSLFGLCLNNRQKAIMKIEQYSRI